MNWNIHLEKGNCSFFLKLYWEQHITVQFNLRRKLWSHFHLVMYFFHFHRWSQAAISFRFLTCTSRLTKYSVFFSAMNVKNLWFFLITSSIWFVMRNTDQTRVHFAMRNCFFKSKSEYFQFFYIPINFIFVTFEIFYIFWLLKWKGSYLWIFEKRKELSTKLFFYIYWYLKER